MYPTFDNKTCEPPPPPKLLNCSQVLTILSLKVKTWYDNNDLLIMKNHWLSKVQSWQSTFRYNLCKCCSKGSTILSWATRGVKGCYRFPQKFCIQVFSVLGTIIFVRNLITGGVSENLVGKLIKQFEFLALVNSSHRSSVYFAFRTNHVLRIIQVDNCMTLDKSKRNTVLYTLSNAKLCRTRLQYSTNSKS